MAAFSCRATTKNVGGSALTKVAVFFSVSQAQSTNHTPTFRNHGLVAAPTIGFLRDMISEPLTKLDEPTRSLSLTGLFDQSESPSAIELSATAGIFSSSATCAIRLSKNST